MNLVKKIRQDRGLSQLKLSMLTGLPQPLISQIENGRIVPYEGWKKKLSKALKAAPGELFPEKEAANGK